MGTSLTRSCIHVRARYIDKTDKFFKIWDGNPTLRMHSQVSSTESTTDLAEANRIVRRVRDVSDIQAETTPSLGMYLAIFESSISPVYFQGSNNNTYMFFNFVRYALYSRRWRIKFLGSVEQKARTVGTPRTGNAQKTRLARKRIRLRKLSLRSYSGIWQNNGVIKTEART